MCVCVCVCGMGGGTEKGKKKSEKKTRTYLAFTLQGGLYLETHSTKGQLVGVTRDTSLKKLNEEATPT